MGHVKKIPLRKGVGCQEMKSKKEMLRILKTPDEEIILDATGKKNGRGAYICRNADCIDKARKSRRFERTFSCKIDDSVYEVMNDELRKETENS